ncbi:MAG: hypothetical protein A3B68_02825 [Candidatus Melainabacteria bacterium RIFCSPHIGHO2_02_FULL_34_12]|nr:MAG: hypothetical protein A3B68_02825 [Candidatus Melainabacteria bacterium RIFCSPHIGHO2_02_FULL_34_12]
MKLDAINLGTFTRQSISVLLALRQEQRKAETLVLNELVVDDKIAPLDIKLMIEHGYVVVTTEFKDDAGNEHTEPLFELIGTTGKVMSLLESGLPDDSEGVRRVMERAVRESIEGLHDADYLLARRFIAQHSPIRIAETPAHLRGSRRVPGSKPMCNLELVALMSSGANPIKIPPDHIADDLLLEVGSKKSRIRILRDAA